MLEYTKVKKMLTLFDFVTNESETIDIKQPYSLHIRLLVPIDQINNMPRNYYVGLNGWNE